MHLSLANRRTLYINVAASVHAALVAGKPFREKPAQAAVLARAHAAAAVREARIDAKQAKSAKQRKP